VILATTTLIVVMSMVHGMDVYVAQQVSDMGTDGFQVQRIPLLGDFDPKKLIELDRRNPKLTWDEYRYLKSQLTLVREFGMSADQSVSVHYPRPSYGWSGDDGRDCEHGRHFGHGGGHGQVHHGIRQPAAHQRRIHR